MVNPMEVGSVLGALINERMRALGLNQTTLSKRTKNELRQNYISQVIRGEIEVPLGRREAGLPRGDAAIVYLAEEIAPTLALFATMDSTDQNVVLRYLIEVVILEGKQTRLRWRPEALRAFGLTESEVVIG